jgi:hypothetical protein
MKITTKGDTTIMTTHTAPDRPMQANLDARTLLREFFLSYCVDPAETEFQCGFLACAISLWDEMQLGYDEAKAKAEAINGLTSAVAYH